MWGPETNPKILPTKHMSLTVEFSLQPCSFSLCEIKPKLVEAHKTGLFHHPSWGLNCSVKTWSPGPGSKQAVLRRVRTSEKNGTPRRLIPSLEDRGASLHTHALPLLSSDLRLAPLPLLYSPERLQARLPELSEHRASPLAPRDC